MIALPSIMEAAEQSARFIPNGKINESKVSTMIQNYPSSFHTSFRCCRMLFGRRRVLHSRTVRIGYGPVGGDGASFAPNKVCNQKYNIFSFVPLVLFQQFKFFLNLYFLLMACSQFIPAIQIGAPITYWGPL
ncbi:unnamed protein product, partial [Strongylus vulgaris]